MEVRSVCTKAELTGLACAQGCHHERPVCITGSCLVDRWHITFNMTAPPQSQLLVCNHDSGDLQLVVPRHSVTPVGRPQAFRGVRPRACRLHYKRPGWAVTDDTVGWHKLLAWDLAAGEALLLGSQADDAAWYETHGGN